MEEIWMQVGNYGFPMLVAIYLLVRLEHKLDALTATITPGAVISIYLPAGDGCQRNSGDNPLRRWRVFIVGMMAGQSSR